MRSKIDKTLGGFARNNKNAIGARGAGGAGAAAGQLSIRRTSDRKHLSHTHSQLRLARTHERIEIEIEIDVPVGGSSRENSLPLNLRCMYIWNPYLNIYIYLLLKYMYLNSHLRHVFNTYKIHI